MNNKNTLKLIFISLFLFLVLLPLSLQIDFYQNDDWVYYKNVEWFMRGRFELHPYMGPTFFVQGFIAALFAKAFSLTRLPVLTLFFSVFNFFLVSIICLRFFKKSVLECVLLASLYFFNPMQMYETLGFMTGNYFMFFLLICIYLYLLYQETNRSLLLYLIYIISFPALLVRQVALMIPLSISIHLLTKKKFIHSTLAFFVFILFSSYLIYIFPTTEAMYGALLQYHHLYDFDYGYALIYGILIIVVALLAPLFALTVDFKKFFVDRLRFVLFLSLTVGLYFFLNSIFEPHEVSWGEFPYFENTFERTGFYPRGISGTKYQFAGNYDLYKYWDLGAKILLSIFISYSIFYKAFRLNFFSVTLAVYMFIMVLTETFYDRYILIFIPLTTFYLLSTKKSFGFISKAIIFVFLLFMIFLMYQFSMDFVLVNKYVWNKSVEITKSENLEEKYIQGPNAWKLNFRNEARDYKYNFSYDSAKVNEAYSNNYDIVEIHEIKFPFNIFINPRIYLYKLK